MLSRRVAEGLGLPAAHRLGTIGGMDWSVRDNLDEQHYEIVAGDTVGGIVAYELRDDVMTMVHTEVDSEYEGEGLGSTLAQGALEDARARKFSVIPQCPFIRSYLKRHSEYVDMVPTVRRAEFGLA